MADDINKKNSIDIEINTGCQQQINQYDLKYYYAEWHNKAY